MPCALPARWRHDAVLLLGRDPREGHAAGAGAAAPGVGQAGCQGRAGGAGAGKDDGHVVLAVLLNGELMPAAARRVMGEERKTSQPAKKQCVCGEMDGVLYMKCARLAWLIDN